MKHSTTTATLAFVAAVMMSMPCMAQDVEPPFAWEGEGSGSFISQYGTEDLDFRFRLSVDEQGMVEGRTTSENGDAEIKHCFYTEAKQYEFPGFFARNIVIVFMLNEYGDTPMLSILNGRVLLDRFLYGEVLLARYEASSDIAKALGVGNAEATLMEGDELPYGVRSALRKCMPFGTAKIEGDFTSVADSESRESGAIALCNGEDFEGWQFYLKDPSADPKSVWKLRDGEIFCTGNPTGFLRTAEQYSDYKLVLEWRWPEKPGNSGVLLHMSSEEKIWPRCMEAQLMHARAGDFVGMGCYFNESKAAKGGPISYRPHMNDTNEKELGGWNKYEITCKDDTIEARVNGLLQNQATGVTITKGHIGLQSEGVPIMFRNIKLTPLR